MKTLEPFQPRGVIPPTYSTQHVAKCAQRDIGRCLQIGVALKHGIAARVEDHGRCKDAIGPIVEC
jgi:hypothetical protein